MYQVCFYECFYESFKQTKPNNFICFLYQGFPVFATVIMANHILRKDEANATKNMTDDDIKAIVALSKVKSFSIQMCLGY